MRFMLLLNVAFVVGPSAVRGQGSCDTSGNVYVSITEMFSTLIFCSFPSHQLNSSCVSTACPRLSQDDACPLTTTGSLNQTALDLLTQTINDCVAETEIICGVTFEQMPLVMVNFSMAEIFKGLPVTGTCATNPGTKWMENVSSARLTSAKPSTSGANSLTLTLAAKNITYYGYLTCFFTLTTFLVQQSLSFPRMFGILHLNMTPAVTYDLTADPPSFNRMSNPFNMDLTYSNFTTSDGVKLPQALVSVFSDVMAGFLKESPVADAPAYFLSTFYAYALQLALKTCP